MSVAVGVTLQLKETIDRYYAKGLDDENLVRDLVQENCGGTTYPSSITDDRINHVDFWWDSPKMGRIGVDVKGIRKQGRKMKEKDDTINWIELQGVSGYPGWIYGKATYIAFRTYEDIIFVKTSVLRTWAEGVMAQHPQITYQLPEDFYIPYQRCGRQDIIFKCPTSDLRNLSQTGGFTLKYATTES